MIDPEKTKEQITINCIESILNDNQTLISFMNKRNEFTDIDTNEYIDAINSYMNYMVKKSNELSEGVFNLVNYLNVYYKKNIQFSYEDYRNQTMNLIEISVLESILKDEVVFNQFMDYQNNEEKFEHIPIPEYLNSLKDMIEYYNKNNIDISSLEIKRYNEIIKKYQEEMNKNFYLDGYVPTGKMNKEFEEKIFKNVDLTTNKFVMARALYIELCSSVKYDVIFALLNQDINNGKARAVYDRSIEEVSLENNKIVCKTWAELYASLLKKVGINAVVSGNFHKYVTFDCEGMLMKADATNLFSDQKGKRLSDLTRIQMNMPTEGYQCLQREKDITPLLKQTDEEINYYQEVKKDKRKSLEEEYLLNSANQKKAKLSLEEKTKMINMLGNNNTLTGLEYVSYLKLLTTLVFSDEEKHNVATCSMGRYTKDNCYDSAFLLSIGKEEEDYHYYLYAKGYKIIECKKEQIKKYLDRESLIPLGKHPNIPGIMEEKQDGRTL